MANPNPKNKFQKGHARLAGASIGRLRLTLAR